MSRALSSLKRLTFEASDVRKFAGIVRRLCRGLDIPGFENPDLLREFFAKLARYKNLHDLRAGFGRWPSLAVGPITRADIQLFFAYNLHLMTGISLPQAWQRAGRARLRSLSIDQYTVERQQEECSQAQGMSGNPHAEVEAPSLGRNWHEEQLRFLKLGAPSYDFCVRSNGSAFNWASFTSLYDAIRSSYFERSIIDPQGQYVDVSEEAIDSFLRTTLIPQSWMPLSQHIQNGLAVSDHEVVWLFVESGHCIGRAIRHKAHGGVLPRLFLTEEEVAEGLSFVLRDAYLQHGSSLLPTGVQSPRGDDAVYTLKPGAGCPGKVYDRSKELRVSTADLELIPNLYAGYLTMVQPYRGTRQVVWGLDGKAVKARYDGSLSNTYFETTPWLAEPDMLSLFPDFRAGPPVNDRDPFAFARDVPNKVLLPPRALDFQNRATSILARKERSAHQALLKLADTGEFLAICKGDLPANRLEVLAGELLAQMSFDPIGAEFSERAQDVWTRITRRFPSLDYYGPLALSASIYIHRNGVSRDETYLDTLTLSDVLIGLVMLPAGFKKGDRFRFFKPALFQVVAAQWLDGITELDDIHNVADELEKHAEALAAQQTRIALVKEALDRQDDRRREAFNHGYVFVGSELPRAKPRLRPKAV